MGLFRAMTVVYLRGIFSFCRRARLTVVPVSNDVQHSYYYYYIIIERKDLGGVMSKDCKDTLQTLKTVTKRECDAK